MIAMGMNYELGGFSADGGAESSIWRPLHPGLKHRHVVLKTLKHIAPGAIIVIHQLAGFQFGAKLNHLPPITNYKTIYHSNSPLSNLLAIRGPARSARTTSSRRGRWPWGFHLASSRAASLNPASIRGGLCFPPIWIFLRSYQSRSQV